MIEVLNKHKIVEPLPNSVYIGRGSIFGNPFTHRKLSETIAKYYVETRKEAIESYRSYMEDQYLTNQKFKDEIDKLVELNKRNVSIKLLCFCKPKSCHGDILKEFIEQKSSNSLW